MTPAAPAKDASSSWVKKKTNIANQSEVDYKKLALVNDDLLKVLSLLFVVEIVCKITPQERI